jgi:cytochrome P450
MQHYLATMVAERRRRPQDDLLTRLIEAEVDGERLTGEEILGFFQMPMVGGQETTTDLIDNAMLCLAEHPDQLARLHAQPELLESAIEEVLRYRSPLQWLMRTPRRDTQVHGQTIPAGALVLAMADSANRDPKMFAEPNRFDICAFAESAHRLRARGALLPGSGALPAGSEDRARRSAGAVRKL